ncbi:hypothetical protein [Trinickia mobilis]|uniref:hypothetical protein n=1 Tax=Trinickia mobilis TaxID=2816356 RepID=UPI001A8F6CBF|nr:hypothetical protein [Trinickia mobilis]
MDEQELRAAQRQLLESVIAAAGAEYKTLSDTYEMIDTKAQAATTIAGVFLAAMFSLSALRFHDSVSAITIGCVFFIMLLLLACIVFAIAAMYTRETEDPPCTNQCLPEAVKVLETKDIATFQDERLRLMKGWGDGWVRANVSVQKANGEKAVWLHRAQLTILAAAFITVLLGALLLFLPATLIPASATPAQVATHAQDQPQTAPNSITISPTITVDGQQERPKDPLVQCCCTSNDAASHSLPPARKKACH